MSLEAKLKALAADATTDTVAGRLFPRRLPDPDPKMTNLPAIVILRVGTAYDGDLNSAGHKAIRYRLTPWAKTSAEVTAVAEDLHDALDLTRSLPEIDRILPDNDSDRYDETANLYGRDLDFLVFSP